MSLPDRSDASAGRWAPIPISVFETFIGQLAHDIRNDLNLASLRASILEASLTDGSAEMLELAEVKLPLFKAERRISKLTKLVLSPSPSLEPIAADVLMDSIKGAAQEALFSRPLDSWSFDASNTVVCVDLGLMAEAIIEILAEASHFRNEETKIAVEATGCSGDLRIAIRESNSSRPASLFPWGTPLANCRRDRYDLEIFFATRVIEQHHGTIGRKIDEATETYETIIRLPSQQ